MDKKILKEMWGSYPEAAKALQITKGALHQWKEVLDNHKIDRVYGASVRTGVFDVRFFPKEWKVDGKNEE